MLINTLHITPLAPGASVAGESINTTFISPLLSSSHFTANAASKTLRKVTDVPMYNESAAEETGALHLG